MALTMPLSLAAFQDLLLLGNVTPRLTEAVETSETGGGEILRADYGPRLWEWSMPLVPGPRSSVEAMVALVERLQEADGSFFWTPPHRQRTSAPAATLSAVQNGRELKLAMTSGETVAAGDFLSFSYGTPTRFALHRALVAGVSSGGVTDWIEVSPAIRPGYTLTNAVELARPVCKAVLLPGSVAPITSTPDAVSRGLAFSMRQTLR